MTHTRYATHRPQLPPLGPPAIGCSATGGVARAAARAARVALVAAALAVVGWAAWMVGPSPAHAAAARNIVLFVTDDQSPDAGCYGNSVIKTPQLDQLASDGVRFTQAFCTTASCSASRSVILTGLYNHANAQYGHLHSYHHFQTYGDIKSLSAHLSAAGYRTARIGKFHVGPDEVYPFDVVLNANSRSPVEMADKCREFVTAKDPRPFFLYFCTSDPHRSGGVVPGAEHNPNPFGNRPDGYPGVKPVKYAPEDVLVPPFLPDTPVCRAELAQYYQSVSRIDQGLGRLIQLLKEADAYEQSLIVYTSDHGIAFPGGKTTLYEGGMRIPFVVRSPDLKQNRGGTCDALINLADVTPTLVAYGRGGRPGKAAAADAPADPKPNAPPRGGSRRPRADRQTFHGRNFLPILDNPHPAGWDQVNASHTFHEITMYYPMRVVRTRQYKLIWNLAHGLPYPFASDLWTAPTWQDIYRQGMDAYYGKRTVKAYLHRPKFELYDLRQDPDEANNLADSPTHQEVLKDLQMEIRRFQERTGDPWKLKWDYE